MAAASRFGLQYLHRSSSSVYDKNPCQPFFFFFFRGFSSTLFVKGISFSTTEDKLADSFSQFGKVVEAKVIVNKVNNRPKGYGYVTFAEEDDANKALTVMNGQLLHGRVIFVDKARPRSHSRTSSQAADK